MSRIITRSEQRDVWKEVEHQLEARRHEPNSHQRWRIKLAMRYVFDEDSYIRGDLAMAVDYPKGDAMKVMIGVCLDAISGYLHNFDEKTRQFSQPRIERLQGRLNKSTVDHGPRPEL